MVDVVADGARESARLELQAGEVRPHVEVGAEADLRLQLRITDVVGEITEVGSVGIQLFDGRRPEGARDASADRPAGHDLEPRTDRTGKRSEIPLTDRNHAVADRDRQRGYGTDPGPVVSPAELEAPRADAELLEHEPRQRVGGSRPGSSEGADRALVARVCPEPDRAFRADRLDRVLMTSHRVDAAEQVVEPRAEDRLTIDAPFNLIVLVVHEVRVERDRAERSGTGKVPGLEPRGPATRFDVDPSRVGTGDLLAGELTRNAIVERIVADRRADHPPARDPARAEPEVHPAHVGGREYALRRTRVTRGAATQLSADRETAERELHGAATRHAPVDGLALQVHHPRRRLRHRARHLLPDHVDHAPERIATVKQSCRAPHDLDPLRRERIDRYRVVGGSGCHVARTLSILEHEHAVAGQPADHRLRGRGTIVLLRYPRYVRDRGRHARFQATPQLRIADHRRGAVGVPRPALPAGAGDHDPRDFQGRGTHRQLHANRIAIDHANTLLHRRIPDPLGRERIRPRREPMEVETPVAVRQFVPPQFAHANVRARKRVARLGICHPPDDPTGTLIRRRRGRSADAGYAERVARHRGTRGLGGRRKPDHDENQHRKSVHSRWHR